MLFDFNYFIEIIPVVLKGLQITLVIAIMSYLLAFIIGLILALVDEYRIRILYPISKVYVSFFRSTPAIALLFFVYFGLPVVVPPLKSLSAIQAAIITLGLSVSAYMGETFRSSINSIDNGQMEAAIAIGMTKFQAMFRIILPQALKVAVPNLGNNFIMTLKSTAVAFTIGINELMGRSKIEASKSYRYFEAYGVVMLVYWVLVVVVSFIQHRFEKSINKM